MPGTAKKKVTPKRAATRARPAKPAAAKGAKRKVVAQKAAAARKPKATKQAKAPKKVVKKKAVPKKVAPKKAAPRVATPAKAPAKKPAAAPAKAPMKAAAKAAVKAAPAKAPAKAAGVKKKTVICELSGFEVTPGAPQLSPKTLERLREKLLEEKDRLGKQSEELAAEAETLAREREAGDTQFDEESGEGDTVNIERERDLLLSASARQVVEEIDEALTRIKKGSYGVCKYAGRKIPIERLEAIPWANVCVDCKARAERRR